MAASSTSPPAPRPRKSRGRPAPATSTRRFWGVDANNIWAVGSQISRWTGTEWLDLGYSNLLYTYRGVWASSPTNVWVVGDGGFIAHGNGYEFTQVPNPTSWNLNAIWGSGPNDIWAVGERGLIMHYGP